MRLGRGRAQRSETDPRQEIAERSRRFATLRAAQRALRSSRSEVRDLAALREIQRWLQRLAVRADGPESSRLAPEQVRQELEQLDGALDGYAALLHRRLDETQVAQLRASLSARSREHRAEALALLELCLESPEASSRYLHVADYVITLLCTHERDGVWLLDADPANLSDFVRERCAATHACGSALEASIAARFQHAAERLAKGEGGDAVVREMAAYKAEIAAFYFVPAVLRCVIGYNAAARNSFERSLQAERELDSAIDAETGFAPPTAEENEAGRRLAPHEHPGVLAVEEALQQRILGAGNDAGPAARLACGLDLELLQEGDRQAFADLRDESQRLVRMTVVLGHLALQLSESRADVTALGLHESQLGVWICDLGEEVQSEIDSRIRVDYWDALRLSDTKSRFLTAVLIAARRRYDEARQRWKGSGEEDHLDRDVLDLVREYLEKSRLHEAPLPFFDLLGGGWRRTLALGAVALLMLGVALSHLGPGDPRAVHELSQRQKLSLSPYLEDAYRDFADDGSILVATAKPSFMELTPRQRKQTLEKVLVEALQVGVEELLIFDAERVLQAHWVDRTWRTDRAWRS